MEYHGKGAMRLGLWLCVLGLLAGCAEPAVVRPVATAGNRTDGIVTMSSMASIFQPARPDWAEADVRVTRQCRGWGYRAPHSFTGDREKCLAYDRNGRCVRSQVHRFYQCKG